MHHFQDFPNPAELCEAFTWEGRAWTAQARRYYRVWLQHQVPSTTLFVHCAQLLGTEAHWRIADRRLQHFWDRRLEVAIEKRYSPGSWARLWDFAVVRVKEWCLLTPSLLEVVDTDPDEWTAELLRRAWVLLGGRQAGVGDEALKRFFRRCWDCLVERYQRPRGADPGPRGLRATRRHFRQYLVRNFGRFILLPDDAFPTPPPLPVPIV